MDRRREEATERTNARRDAPLAPRLGNLGLGLGGKMRGRRFSISHAPEAQRADWPKGTRGKKMPTAALKRDLL